MSDEKEKDTIRKLCGEMAWEHFDQNADPPVELWRVDMERRFVGRQIRQSNWFASKQAADDYARVQTERGSVLMSIVEYHADPAAEIAGLRAANERLRVLLNEIRERDYGACKDAIGLPLMEKIAKELDGNALRGTLPPLTK